MPFYLRILIIFLTVQVIALLVWRRRLKEHRSLRVFLTFLFPAMNLPWFFFFNSLDGPDFPAAWYIEWVVRPFITWQVGIWLWLVVAAAVGILVLLFWRLPRFIRKRTQKETVPLDIPSVERRRFLTTAGRTVVLAGGVGCLGYGLLRSGRLPVVRRYDLPIKDLPPELDGLKIAQITDLHVGLWTTEKELVQALDLVGGLKADLVVVTGDMIDHNPDFSKVLVRHLPLITGAPLGVYGVIGNHDIYTGAARVSAAVSEGGLQMLRNRHHSFREEGLPLALIGVDDPGRHWTGSGGEVPVKTAMAGLSEDHWPLLLVHRPSGFSDAQKAGIPVTLCGHTHGGQFALPGGPNLADGFYRHTHGLYRENGHLIHVSAGLGAVGLPFRLAVPPEVNLLTLVKTGA